MTNSRTEVRNELLAHGYSQAETDYLLRYFGEHRWRFMVMAMHSGMLLFPGEVREAMGW